MLETLVEENTNSRIRRTLIPLIWRKQNKKGAVKDTKVSIYG